jgi:secreted Zn-dependent insulinase-like peptidase
VYDYQACGGKPIDLPPSNKYIAKDLSLIACDLSALPQYPVMIKDDLRSKAYFKQDNKFKIPKTIIKLLVYTRE